MINPKSYLLMGMTFLSKGSPILGVRLFYWGGVTLMMKLFCEAKSHFRGLVLPLPVMLEVQGRDSEPLPSTHNMGGVGWVGFWAFFLYRRVLHGTHLL